MELWDAYNADRTPAGLDIVRGDTPPEEYYHLVVDVIVQHADGSYLVMQRDFSKHHGGCWEVGAGGSVLMGESAYEGALRELQEETGIAADNLILLRELSQKHYPDGYNSHYLVYFCRTDVDKASVKLQQGETIAYRWISAEQLLSEQMIPNRSVELIRELSGNRFIVTERLLLRPIGVEDLPSAHRYASDREITRYMMNLPNDDESETRGFLQDSAQQWGSPEPEFYEFAVMLDNQQIGGVCLYLTEDRTQGELGWILNKQYHGCGYAYEAASAVVRFARRLGLRSVFARCDGRNAPSEQLMKRLGMTLETADGTRYYEKRGEVAPELKYSMEI